MTVTSSTIISGPYTSNGTSLRYPINFQFLDTKHIVVKKKKRDGTELTLAQGIDYAIEGQGEDKGSLQLSTPLESGTEITVLRIVPITQLAEYVQGDPFPAKSHENALDKLTMIAQQQQLQIEKAVVAPLGDGRNTLMGFDQSGLGQYVKISDGLIKENDLLKVKEGVGILSNAQGISVLIGNGLDIYDKAITVHLGHGLEFDAYTRVAIKETLLEAIRNIQGDILDLNGLIANLANRVGKLEQEGGGTVTITIGNGLRYDEEGALTIKTNVGIKVTANGVSVMLGDGLEVDEDGNVQVRIATSSQISAGARGAVVDAAGLALSRLPTMQIFETNGTFTVPVGVKRIRVRLCGGGGGSSGSSANASGGGGGGGGYAEGIYDVIPGTAHEVVIGQGGIAGAANGGAGGQGGTTKFGSLLSAIGGGGAGSTYSGEGGSGEGGQININGKSGMGCSYTNKYLNCYGGSSHLGSDCRAIYTYALPGTTWGSGAAARGVGDNLLVAGAAGYHGVVIVEW